MDVSVSIVILSYNTLDVLRRCIDTTLAQLTGVSSEVIVVDNASGDNSVDMVLSEFPDVRLIRNVSNCGYAAGNNTGILASSGSFVLLLNSDAFLGGDALSGMLDHFRLHPRTGIVGPRLSHPDGSLHLSCRRFPSLLRHLVRITGAYRFWSCRWTREWDWMCDFAHDEPRRVDMISGACWMMRRSMLDEIGLLNENLFLYGEEFDLCWRAAQAAWETWFIPAGPVVHGGGQSSTREACVNVVTNFHRYRSDYLNMRQHLGLSTAVLAACVDQLALRWRFRKARVFQRGDQAMADALAAAVRQSARAATEMMHGVNGKRQVSQS